MEMRNQEVKVHNSGGIGFVGLLTIVFIVLKLTGYITWSWFWVLSPLWITALLVISVMLLVAWTAYGRHRL